MDNQEKTNQKKTEYKFVDERGIVERLRSALALVLLRLAYRTYGNWLYNSDDVIGHGNWLREWKHDVEPQNLLRVAENKLDETYKKSRQAQEEFWWVMQTYDRHEKNLIKNFILLFKGINRSWLDVDFQEDRLIHQKHDDQRLARRRHISKQIKMVLDFVIKKKST